VAGGIFLLIRPELPAHSGAYGLYLLWIGLPLLMRVPDDKALPCAAIVTACAARSRGVLAIV
jgi:hypothetical protein